MKGRHQDFDHLAIDLHLGVGLCEQKLTLLRH